jgi:hypothetical protein
MTGPQDTMGRMSYLSGKETKKRALDEALDTKGFAEGGIPVGAGRPISTVTGKFLPTDEEKWIAGKKLLSALMDISPGIGDVKSAQEALTGEDILTGEKLGTLGRSLAGLAVLPFVPGSIKNIGKIGKKTKDVGTPFMRESASLLQKEIRDFRKMYPDVAEKLAEVNILPQHKMGSPTQRGSFASKASLSARLRPDEQYSINIAEKLLADSSKYKATTATHAFKHEKWHAIRRFTKDKKYDPKYLGESEETLSKFLEMNKFIDSFETRKPFSPYAKKAKQTNEANKYYMELKKYGDPAFKDFVLPKKINYGSENFAEFAQRVETGEITGKLAQQFQELFDPKLFQLSINKPTIPIFKGTEDAARFGVNATKTDITELKRLREQTLLEGKTLQEAGKLQEAYDIGFKAQLYNEAIQASEGRKFIPAGFAEGGMVSNWLKTAYDFYFGKKDVEMTGPQETMGRMSYLSSKESKKERLDEALDIKGFAEGGMIGNWLKTAMNFYFGTKDTAVDKQEETIGRMSYLSSKETKRHKLDEAFNIDAKGFAEGGMVSNWLKTAIVKYINQGNKIYGLNAAGEIIKEIGDNEEKESFLRNKAYAVGRGETDPENVLFKDLAKAKFGVTTRQKTGRRFAGELSKDLSERFPLGDFNTDVLAEQLAKDKQTAKLDPKMRDLLRFPGLKEAPEGFNMTFDRETDVVSGKGLGIGVQSYYDLKEFQYKDMKRAMSAGKLSLPTIAPGFVSTAGEDPTTKDIFKRKEIQKEVLRKRLLQPSRTDLREETDFTPDSEQILQVFGRDTQILYDLQSKLKYLHENTPGGLKSVEQRKDSDLYSKYTKVTDLLKKGPLGKEDLSFVSGLIRDKELSTEVFKLREETEKKQFGLAISPRMAYMISPKMFGEYKKARESGDGSVGFAAQLFFGNKLAEGNNLKKVFDSTRGSVQEQNKLELFFKQFASKFSTDELRKINSNVRIQEIVEQLRKKDPKSAGLKAHEYAKDATSAFQSMPVMHAGGEVRKTGPIFAQKGELVLPRGFADGGFVDDTTSSAILKEGAIKIQDDGIAETIADKITAALENTKVDIKEDAKVGVDIGDVKVPVDVGDVKIGVDLAGVTVPVDTSDVSIGIDVTAAASTLEQSITRAISSASVDVKTTSSTQSVGADKIDEVATSVRDVQDKVFTLRGEMESELETLRGASVNSGTLRAEVENVVNVAMGRIEQDVNDQANIISNLTSKVTRTEQRLDVKIDTANARALDAQNFATRY